MFFLFFRLLAHLLSHFFCDLAAGSIASFFALFPPQPALVSSLLPAVSSSIEALDESSLEPEDAEAPLYFLRRAGVSKQKALKARQALAVFQLSFSPVPCEMSAADFANAKGERFAVALLGEDGAPTQNVVVQVREREVKRREREGGMKQEKWRASSMASEGGGKRR